MTKREFIDEVVRMANFNVPMTKSLRDLKGKTQSVKWHPEGDAWNHSVDALRYIRSQNARLEIQVCALYHDIGKGQTPEEMLPKHIGHDARGVKMVSHLDEIPDEMKPMLRSFIKHHMKKELKDKKKIKKVLEDILQYMTLDEFKLLMKADGGVNQRALPEWLKEV